MLACGHSYLLRCARVKANLHVSRPFTARQLLIIPASRATTKPVSWYDYDAFHALVQVFLSDGHSGFTYPTAYKLADGLESDLAVGDINGDGTFLQPDPWYPWPGYEFSVGPGASDVALGDFTGDGKLDAVVAGVMST